MKMLILVTDIAIRFRIAAIEQATYRPQVWEQQVMTIEQVADILVSLSCLDPSVARSMAEASTTITPQPGLKTVPLSDLVPLVEFVHPDSDPVSPEAQQGHMIVAEAETTEDALARMGFSVKTEAPLQ